MPAPLPELPTTQRPQFRLRTLLIAFVVISALMAGAVRLGPVWSLAIVWCALLVAAHIVGNAWGTKATARTSRELRAGTHDPELPNVGRHEPIPATRLHRSSGVGWTTVVLTTLGALIGGAAGAVGLIAAYAKDGHYVGIVVGLISAAVLGGFLGFMTATSLGKTISAWREAVEHDRRSRGEHSS